MQPPLTTLISHRDDDLNTLAAAVRGAIEHTIRAEARRGRPLPEVVEGVRGKNPAQLLGLLDQDAASGKVKRAELAERARDRSAIYLILGEIEKSEQSARESITLDPVCASAWSALARVLDASGRTEQARVAFRNAIENSMRNTRAHAVAHYGFGVTSIRLAEYKRARESLELALDHGRRADDVSLRLQAAAYLAYAFDLDGQKEAAVPLLLEAIDASEQLGNDSETAECYCHLGLVYLALCKMEQSEAMHRKSLAYGLRNNDVPRIASELFNVANACMQLEKHADAYNMFEDAVTNIMRLGDTRLLAHAYEGLAGAAERLAAVAASDELWPRAADWAAKAAQHWNQAGNEARAAKISEWKDEITAYVDAQNAQQAGS